MMIPFTRKWTLSKISSYLDTLVVSGVGIKRVRRNILSLLKFWRLSLDKSRVVVFKYKDNTNRQKYWKILIRPLFGSDLIIKKYENQPYFISN